MLAHEWGLDLDKIKQMSRREISDALEAINERKGNYQSSATTVNVSEEQEDKIQRAIKERLKDGQNNN